MSKKLIKNITPEQEAFIPEYRERFRAYGLSTERCDRKAAEDAVKRLYVHIEKDEPSFSWYEGPQELMDHIRNRYGKEALVNFESGWSSNFEAFWVSRDCFINEVLPVEKVAAADIARDIVKECGIFYTFEKHVFMIERPELIKFNDREVLDNSGAPAVKFRDGYSMYCIDGVRVTGDDIKYVNLSADEIDVKEVMQIQNVDLRRAVLNKVRPENLLKKLKARHLDSVELSVPVTEVVRGLIETGMYEEADTPALLAHYGSVNTTRLYDLYELDFGEFKGKYLRMENPSIKEEHIEGVSTECMTVEDALRFRDNKDADQPAFSAILS